MRVVGVVVGEGANLAILAVRAAAAVLRSVLLP
jgi:hypothetical protein